MNKLQIVEDIFGTDCFTPYLRIVGNREVLSARNKLNYVNHWSGDSLEYMQLLASRHGYRIGVDFFQKEFTLHPIN
jgi:hypothetical protein